MPDGRKTFAFRRQLKPRSLSPLISISIAISPAALVATARGAPITLHLGVEHPTRKLKSPDAMSTSLSSAIAAEDCAAKPVTNETEAKDAMSVIRVRLFIDRLQFLRSTEWRGTVIGTQDASPQTR